MFLLLLLLHLVTPVYTVCSVDCATLFCRLWILSQCTSKPILVRMDCEWKQHNPYRPIVECVRLTWAYAMHIYSSIKKEKKTISNTVDFLIHCVFAAHINYNHLMWKCVCVFVKLFRPDQFSIHKINSSHCNPTYIYVSQHRQAQAMTINSVICSISYA